MITAIQNNPQTSFKRGIKPEEYTKLLDHDLKTFVEVAHKVGTGEINARDTRLGQFQQVEPDVFIKSKDLLASEKSPQETSFLLELPAMIFGKKAEKPARVPLLAPVRQALKSFDTKAIAEVCSGIGSGKYSPRAVIKHLDAFVKTANPSDAQRFKVMRQTITDLESPRGTLVLPQAKNNKKIN